MRVPFEITQTSREVLSRLLENHTLEQLNKTPEGFSNNLIWNIGHIIVVQQMLVYKLSGVPMLISDEMVNTYKKGTKPEKDITPEEVNQIAALLFETIRQTEVDFNANVFKTYQEFTSMSGFTIKNAEEGLAFNYYHEAIHTGIIMSIRKFIV